MKKIIELKLKILAKLIIARYKPKVVGITGSIGKTSTRDAVYSVLKTKYRCRRSLKNYNNEIGFPLSIIGIESPGKNILGWLFIFLYSLKLIIVKDKNFPEILILEMGVDRPGDMDYLNSIVSCDIAVITWVGISHIEYFGTIEKIKKEKAKILSKIKKGGAAVLNFDNESCRAMISESKSKIVSFGLESKADFKAIEINFNLTENHGTNFKIFHNGSSVPLFLKSSVGYPTVYAALAASAVAHSFGFNMVEISNALLSFNLPKGRMKLIKGVNESLIIDDTYNSAPQSLRKALELLSEIKNNGAMKIVVLGDMLELGSYSEEAHREIGALIHKYKIDKAILLGEESKYILKEALKKGMNKKNISHFSDQNEASAYLNKILNKNDIILIKGSQGARMEKIVKSLMLRKEDASRILVRQEKSWLK